MPRVTAFGRRCQSPAEIDRRGTPRDEQCRNRARKISHGRVAQAASLLPPRLDRPPRQGVRRLRLWPPRRLAACGTADRRSALLFLFGFPPRRRFNSELKMTDTRQLLSQYADDG